MLKQSNRLSQLALVGLLASGSLLAPQQASATPVRDAFHQALPEFTGFLEAVDDLDEVLWTGTSFSEQQVWETMLHSAIAADNPQLEAIAQDALIKLGMSENELTALYRLDPASYDEGYLAVLKFAQRSAVLPTRVNSSDIIELREHYDTTAVTELAMINAYASMFNVLYGTGYVDQDSNMEFATIQPQTVALQQQKIASANGWTDRHFFESPLLALDLSLPFVDLDGVMLEQPHSFNHAEIWEMFTVAQVASDCKHCITHGAYGMHLAMQDHQSVIDAYHYDGTGDYTAREKARLDFVQHALMQPSQVTQAHRDALATHYTETEVQHIVGLSSFMGMLSSYMQITGCITDEESANFAIEVLGPEGFTMGRHVGPRSEQRRMHPMTLYRLTPDRHSEGADGLKRTEMFSSQVMNKVWSESRFPGISGPATHAILQIVLFVGLILGYRKIDRSTPKAH